MAQPQPQPEYVIVREAPPAVIVERRSPPPSGEYIWIDGYWGTGMAASMSGKAATGSARRTSTTSGSRPATKGTSKATGTCRGSGEMSKRNGQGMTNAGIGTEPGESVGHIK